MEQKFDILIVDDDVNLASNLQDILKGAGYNVAVTADGQTAITLYSKKTFDLAVIDIRLPDILGVNLIQKLAGLSPETEYIIITGYASLETAVKAVGQRSIVAYETKPLNMDHLLALIAQVAERKRAECDLHKRVKELKCLYSVADVAGRPDITLDELYQEVVNLLPEAWQYPEITSARISANGREFKTENYRETGWKQSSDITVDGAKTGVIEVSYSEERPEFDEGPFLKEERLLIDAAAERLGRITESKQVEEALRDAREYEDLNKLKTNLLSTVSHELRTPLAAIKGYSTMLLDYDRRLRHEEKQEHLQSIDRATDRLTELVDRLLDMSRLEAGLLKLVKEPTSISKLVQEAVAEAKLRAPKHNIELALPKRLPKLNIDPRRIRQVLDNIIDNAIKYSKEETKVVVSAQRTGRKLLVSVADQGTGIPTKEQRRVFDRMYRIEQRLSPEIGGVGLGLSICKGLVKAHGGRIWVESKVGQGSTFFFALPVQTIAKVYSYEKET